MKFKNILITVCVAASVLIVYYSFLGGTDKNYINQLIQERKAKDEFMRAGSDSLFGENKNNFKNLNYFPPNDDYRINAKLIPIENKKTILLPTSDGAEKKYLEYAYAEFELRNALCKLLILEIIDNNEYRGTLFLAFADSTSANETYGAGRYLDLKKTPGASSILLDFNKAYNPYCAYSDNFSCPFPPKENILNVAIRAGEKKYHE